MAYFFTRLLQIPRPLCVEKLELLHLTAFLNSHRLILQSLLLQLLQLRLQELLLTVLVTLQGDNFFTKRFYLAIVFGLQFFHRFFVFKYSFLDLLFMLYLLGSLCLF